MKHREYAIQQLFDHVSKSCAFDQNFESLRSYFKECPEIKQEVINAIYDYAKSLKQIHEELKKTIEIFELITWYESENCLQKHLPFF